MSLSVTSHFVPQCFAAYFSHCSCALEPLKHLLAAAMSAYEAQATRSARVATASFIVRFGGRVGLGCLGVVEAMLLVER